MFAKLKEVHEQCRVLRLQKRHSSFSLEQIEDSLDQQYLSVCGRKIDWQNPKSFTEKTNVYKVHHYNELKSRCADKYEVRAWVEEKIGKDHLIPVYGLYEDFEDIRFDDLPDRFVMKCTHDCNSTTIVEDKNSLCLSALKKRYDYFKKVNLAYLNFELHYKNIKPRILIEESIGSNIDDYKFLCFGGAPYYCWVDKDRLGDHKRMVFDMEWNEAPFQIGTYKKIRERIERPENFDEMVEIAKKLSAGFSQVRVDLYSEKGVVYFGEMTFTTANGMIRFFPEEYDFQLGDLWNLETERKNSDEIKAYLSDE